MCPQRAGRQHRDPRRNWRRSCLNRAIDTVRVLPGPLYNLSASIMRDILCCATRALHSAGYSSSLLLLLSLHVGTFSSVAWVQGTLAPSRSVLSRGWQEEVVVFCGGGVSGMISIFPLIYHGSECLGMTDECCDRFRNEWRKWSFETEFSQWFCYHGMNRRITKPRGSWWIWMFWNDWWVLQTFLNEWRRWSFETELGHGAIARISKLSN